MTNCASCGVTTEQTEADGNALISVTIALGGTSSVTALLCPDCVPTKLLTAMGMPRWQAAGWRTKADALADGWEG